MAGALRSMQRQAKQRGAQEQGTATAGQVVGQVGAAGAQQQAQQPQGQPQSEPSPQQQKAMESYQTLLMKAIHAPETRDSVVEMLGSAPPEQSLPATALQVNKLVEDGLKQKQGSEVDTSVKVAGAIYLVADLIEIGNASAGWGITEEQATPLLQETMKQYIHQGIRDGSIDPVQLQQDTEPLLNEAQRDVGMQLSNELGMSDEPTAQMGIQKVTADKMAPLEKENKMLKGQLKGGQGQGQVAPQGQPQPQPQGVA